MLIFKTKGIILKIHKLGEKDFLYTIFTQDYGKIICQKKISKTEKTLDLGYIISFEIETKEERKIHKIRNIRIMSEFKTQNTPFIIINNYLENLNLLIKNTPDGTPIYGIIEIFEEIQAIENIDEIKLNLSRLKILHFLGLLPDNHPDIVVQKILKFIHVNKIDRIIKLTGIHVEIQEKLKKI